jgi:hypothetical protein
MESPPYLIPAIKIHGTPFYMCAHSERSSSRRPANTPALPTPNYTGAITYWTYDGRFESNPL